MSRKNDPTTLDHQIIRRALRLVGPYQIVFSEFTATWEDFMTMKQVDFFGQVDSEISLRRAQIVGSDIAYDLKTVFSAPELKAFDHAVNSAHRLREFGLEMTAA